MTTTPSPSDPADAPSAASAPSAPPPQVAVLPLTGLGEVREGADLAALLAGALAPLAPR